VKKVLSLGLSLLVISPIAWSKAPVIYGEDNRREVYDVPSEQQELASSVATMVRKEDIVSDSSKSDVVELNQLTLKEILESELAQEDESSDGPKISLKLFEQAKKQDSLEVCAGEPFLNQPSPGGCTGFLIGPDLIATAGHCVTLPNFCENYQWVFDFKLDRKTQLAGIDLPRENIYSCKKIVSNALNMPLGLDYGLVLLDRKVTGRKPLKLQLEKFAPKETDLIVMGSPMGLPLKVADGAKIRESSHPFYFVANLDTFEGNSGSPVFNKETLEVEGILVRGEEDFGLNADKMCIEAKKCADGECSGESVTRVSSVPEISFQRILSNAASSGNEAAIDSLLTLNLWVDMFSEKGITALMRASKNQLPSIMEKLIQHGADVNRSDVDGDKPLHYLTMNLSEKNLQALNLLIASGASLEAKNIKGETPLLSAARWLNLSAVKLLLNAGSDKNARNAAGENVIQIFKNAGDFQSVDELLALGLENAPATMIQE
jgi:hypothetical protein